MCRRCMASWGEARSMESGIIADVDRLKESRRGDPLPYLCNERSPCVSCLRPRPEHIETLSRPCSFLPTLSIIFPLSSSDFYELSWCFCNRCPWKSPRPYWVDAASHPLSPSDPFSELSIAASFLELQIMDLLTLTEQDKCIEHFWKIEDIIALALCILFKLYFITILLSLIMPEIPSWA